MLHNCISELVDESICPSSYHEVNSDGEKYICLSDLQEGETSYIQSVKYKNQYCKGIIVYTNDEEIGLNDNSKVYLYCGNADDDKYDYVTDESIDPTKYSRCNIKVNSDLYYIQLMEMKLVEIHSVLQKENELIVQASNDISSLTQRETIKKEVAKLNEEINKIYNYEYLNNKIFNKDNKLTGKYVVQDVSVSGLKLGDLTYSDFVKDKKIIDEAMKSISYFRSYLGASQNALEYRFEFNKCKDNNCKLDIVSDIVNRIYELSYTATFSSTNIDDDLICINLEVQKLFDNLDIFSEKMNDNLISKNSIFPNGKDTLNSENSKKVYQDASIYIKQNTDKDLRNPNIWFDQISMYQTAKGLVEEILSITNRQDELITKCSSSISEEDRNNIQEEINALYNEIERIIITASFNNIKILSDSNHYNDYLLYDLSDNNLKNISCTASSSNKVVIDYQSKINLNIVSLNAHINKANKLVEFAECNDTKCVNDVVVNILNAMLELSDKAINTDDNNRKEYNIEYVTYFKALDHISEISENDNYSAKGLGTDTTNILTIRSANSAKSLIKDIIFNIK